MAYKFQVQNYRPISVLPVLIKVIERVVHTHLEYLSRSARLSVQTSAWIWSGHSTQQAITQVNDWVLEAMSLHGLHCIVYRYFKSIDSQIHKVLLVKLESLGLSPRSLRWFRSYLADRCESVLINGELSDFSPITHDVPQGSILSPLLLNMYIYRLWNAVQKARVILYADDTDCANVLRQPP